MYCGYCGVELSTIVFITKDNMHIQKAEILTVCDKCAKPTTVIYDQGEFKKEKPKNVVVAPHIEPNAEILLCKTCGGSIGESGYCRPCAAMGQKT